MPNQERGNGRNVSIPDENRPSWRPQDDSVTPRARRPLAAEDEERYRYGSHWEDRDWDRERDEYRPYGQSGYAGRAFGEERSRSASYPGSFEERSRERGDDRFGGRGAPIHGQERGYPERYGTGRWEAERLGTPRGGYEPRERGYEPRGFERGGYERDVYERGFEPRGHEGRGEPRGYGYGDGDRPNLGVGGPMQYTGYSSGYTGREHRGEHATGYRGKGPAGYQRSDERIREIVCEVLTDDDRVDASKIEVQVKGGEVLLSGTVPERQMKRLAEDAIEGVTGVKDVQNQIKVADGAGEKRSRT